MIMATEQYVNVINLDKVKIIKLTPIGAGRGMEMNPTVHFLIFHWEEGGGGGC